MIIVEGADSSGKTTLIRRIREEFLSLVSAKGQGPKNNYTFWVLSLRKLPRELAQVVWDRFYFSELAYGTVIRNKVNLTSQQKEVIESLLWSADPLIIHCSLIPDERRFSSRNQLFTWEQNKRVAEFYPILLKEWEVFHFTPGTTTKEEVSLAIAKYLHTRERWLKLRRACPYGRGNLYNPGLMIVGEKFGPNNPLSIPMERSKTGVMVHNALRSSGLTMRDVWITNAFKYGGDLTPRNLKELMSEYTLLRPNGIIALGKRAAGALSILRIPHIRVNHPGYYMRRGEKELFQVDFKEAWKNIERRKESESD